MLLCIPSISLFFCVAFDPKWSKALVIQPTILATHDHPCNEPEEWSIRSRRGAWSMWIMLDGRARWVRQNQPTQRLSPGDLLLRWRGIGGHLELQPGCFLRGIEFDIIDRPRRPHHNYGWQPISGNQPAPKKKLVKIHRISSMTVSPCKLVA